ERYADARAMATALAEAAAELWAAGTRATLSPAARPSGRSRRRRGFGGVLRAGALLVAGVSALAIGVASSVIYLLDSPRGDERRVLLQRVLASVLNEPSAASEPPGASAPPAPPER